MTQIKIGGLNRMEDIAGANLAKPDYVDFVFSPDSRYCVTHEKAARMKERLDPAIQVVGVFRNADPEEIRELCRVKLIDIVQLAGGEDEVYQTMLKMSIPNLVIKAVRAQYAEQIAAADDTPCDALLLDLFDPMANGGAGKLFDFTRVPRLKHSVFLSGGLDESNVLAAIDACRPVCVELSAGVETNGMKDPEKMRRVVELIRGHVTASPGAGVFGPYGGQEVPSALLSELQSLELAAEQAKADEKFSREFSDLLEHWAGRPTPLYFARNWTEKTGGAKLFLKREDLCHTRAQAVCHVLGFGLLARRMGRKKLTAAGNGPFALPFASACAFLGLSCTLFRSGPAPAPEEARQLELLGAEVRPVEGGTLLDAEQAAFSAWADDPASMLYVPTSAVAPHPYPALVRDFQKAVGEELRAQLPALCAKLPDAVLAPVGGAGDPMGTFFDFVRDESTLLVGCQDAAVVPPVSAPDQIAGYTGGVLLGGRTLCAAPQAGGTAGWDESVSLPGIGPELASLLAGGRVQFVPVTREDADRAARSVARSEGILLSAPSARAAAYAEKLAPGPG